MRRQLFSFLVFIFSFTTLCSQVNDGCIFIDFESIPNTVISNGIQISDQYKEEFGLSFSLQNGQSPVLAATGGQLEAFTSLWGNDTPAPNIDIGQYFLTDDGNAGSNVSSPLILEFEIPIDSFFSGCILDLDFSESFTIEAFDIDDNIILSETISDGDPGTGDGSLSCWGFNLPGCEGSIYKIVYTGTRTDLAGFGLGLDRFSFCYSGLNIEVETEDYSCNQGGQLLIQTLTQETYEFSIDGINFSSSTSFTDLQPGIYQLHVRDSEGCETALDFQINALSDLEADIMLSPVTCEQDNGLIEINAIPNNNAEYSINGEAFQSDNVF